MPGRDLIDRARKALGSRYTDITPGGRGGKGAERAGARATGGTTYRCVMAVPKGGGVGLEPYVAAARAGLTRLGVGDTVPR